MRLEAKADLFVQFAHFALLIKVSIIKLLIQKDSGFFVVADFPSLFKYPAWYGIKFVDDDLSNLYILASAAVTGDNHDTV